MALDQNAGTVTKKNLKATGGNVFGCRVTNIGASLRWFQIFDKATAPIAGDIPVEFFPMPAGSATQPTVLEINRDQLDGGIPCVSGVGWALSTTPGTFTDAATATDHTVTVRYQ